MDSLGLFARQKRRAVDQLRGFSFARNWQSQRLARSLADEWVAAWLANSGWGRAAREARSAHIEVLVSDFWPNFEEIGGFLRVGICLQSSQTSLFWRLGCLLVARRAWAVNGFSAIYHALLPRAGAI